MSITDLIMTTKPCTYHLNDIFFETDKITDKDKDFIRNCIYRQEILNTFGLEEFNEKKIEINMREIYKYIEKDYDFLIFIDLLLTKYSFSKEECFMILFSFDYFYATLECLKDYFKNGYITTFHHEMLKKNINLSIINK